MKWATNKQRSQEVEAYAGMVIREAKANKAIAKKLCEIVLRYTPNTIAGQIAASVLKYLPTKSKDWISDKQGTVLDQFLCLIPTMVSEAVQFMTELENETPLQKLVREVDSDINELARRYLLLQAENETLKNKLTNI